jgi:hypothetical protein
MRNSAFAIFSCLRMYEEQRMRHLRILENMDDLIPKHYVGDFCTLADPSVLLSFRCTL